MEFVKDLQQAFLTTANRRDQRQMEIYMQELFPYHGIKAPKRKEIIKKILANHKDFVKENIHDVVKVLYNLPQREYHYTAIDLYLKFMKKKFELKDGRFITRMITTHSWWDTVDILAKHALGNYLLQFPEQKRKMIDYYTEHSDFWLNRSAILFQLGYKDKTDANELFFHCKKHAHSEEFFIQKAIGWALREYGKVNPEAVIQFVKNNTLQALSEREALRRLI